MDSDKVELHISYRMRSKGRYDLLIEDVVGGKRNPILPGGEVTRRSMVQLILSTITNVGATDVYVHHNKNDEPARLSQRFVTELREGTLGLEDILL